ncbi:MAG: CPBP family intramembrane metalloprotease [Clostridia bacterium]|nr:CPBP family intramembrane metalloprotease [Clostridia bacterium]
MLISLMKAAAYIGVFLGVQMAVTTLLTVGGILVLDMLYFSAGISISNQALFENLLPAVTVLSCAVTLLLLWLFFAVRGKSFAREVRWHRLTSPGAAVLGPLECGFGLSIVSSFAMAMIPFPEAWYASFDEANVLLLTGNALFQAFAAVIAAPILEEIVFRGLIYTRLCRGMKRWIAAILSAVLFGMVHGTLLALVYTIPMGLLLCLFYEKYRSLWAPILLHMGFNLAGTVTEAFYDAPDSVMLLLAGIGLYLTVSGFVSMWVYRRDSGLYCKPVKKSRSVPSDADNF